jgi:hypothetical protein
MDGVGFISAACAVGPAHRSRQRKLSRTIYAAALIELCGRIWAELESLADLWEQSDIADAPSVLLMSAATLRLELLVMLDSCDSVLWRSLLEYGQRQNLRSMLIDVLETIAVTPDLLKRQVIERAQDRLLDEVFTQFHITNDRDITNDRADQLETAAVDPFPPKARAAMESA